MSLQNNVKKEVKMKKIGIIIVIVIIGISVGGCQRQLRKPEQFEKVTIGISATSLLASLVHIAEERGYFLEEGIDVEIKGYPTGKAALAATLSGEVDMGTVADTPIVSNSFERNDFAIVVTIINSAQHSKALARKDSNINTPQDLVGKKVATTVGTTAHYFMAVFFILNKLDISDVEIVNLKPGEMVEAIVNGDVDAIFAWEPNILKATKSLGDNAVILPSDVGYEATFNLVTMNDYIGNNPELIRKVIKALAKAEEFITNNREESIKIIALRLKIDRDYMDKIWDGYRFGIFLSQTLILTLEDVARWSIRNNFTDKTEVPNYLDYIYMDALEEVKPEAVTIMQGGH